MRSLLALVLAVATVAAAGKAVAWEAVSCLQNQMNALGYGPLAVDGQIGPATRVALARYEGVAGTLPARRLDGHSAIIHCRKLGLRHPAARLAWPSRDEPFRMIPQADVSVVYQDVTRYAVSGTLNFFRTELSIELAAPFVVVIGSNPKSITANARPYLARGFTASTLSRELVQTCAGPGLRGLSYPGLLMMCQPSETGWTDSGALSQIRWTVGHELVHEAQWQLFGNDPGQSVEQVLAMRGPFWLIEGAAEVLSGRGMSLDDAGWFLQRAIDLPDDAPGDLRKLERPMSVSKVGDRLYILGSGAASQLALRKSGLAGLLAFYGRLGEGADWPAAFEQSFGIAPGMFYANWDAARATR